jgi:hypothetical protein
MTFLSKKKERRRTNDTQPRKVEQHRRGTESTGGNYQAVCFGLPISEYRTVINDKNRSTEDQSCYGSVLKSGEMFQVNQPFYI